ncbi:Fc.00g064700.m01.CDS01 [Cosmosporella sp. VM-42]
MAGQVHREDDQGMVRVDSRANQDTGSNGITETRMAVDNSQLNPEAAPHHTILKREEVNIPSQVATLRMEPYRREMSLVPESEAGEPPVLRLKIAQEVHDICLQASQDYIKSFRRNIEQRCRPLGDRSRNGSPTDLIVGENQSTAIFREAQPTTSLKTNIRSICSIFWARAFALQMFSTNPELTAAFDMSYVLEATARIMDGLDQQEDGTGKAARAIVRAGVIFCEHLEQWDRRAEVISHGDSYPGAKFLG